MITSNNLWLQLPSRAELPCKGGFRNQCAIRMGIGLSRTGVNLDSFKGVRCWHDNPKHILRAQELANWMSDNPQYFGEKTVYKNVTYKDFSGKKGIVFIQDGWLRGTDHIDVWNGSIMKNGSAEYFSLGKIWFWEI